MSCLQIQSVCVGKAYACAYATSNTTHANRYSCSAYATQLPHLCGCFRFVVCLHVCVCFSILCLPAWGTHQTLEGDEAEEAQQHASAPAIAHLTDMPLDPIVTIASGNCSMHCHCVCHLRGRPTAACTAIVSVVQDPDQHEEQCQKTSQKMHQHATSLCHKAK